MYIISYDNSSNNFKLSKVNIIKRNKDNSLILLDNKDKMEVSNSNLYKDREIALLVAKERNIIRNFKTKYKKRKCSICNKKIQPGLITVDHIVPKAYFKKLNSGKDIRTDIELWSECWNFKNLQICCESCNQNKADSNEQYLNKIDYYARTFNLKKLKQESSSIHGRVKKIGHKVSTSKKYSNAFKHLEALEICKKDGREIPLQLISNINFIYDNLLNIF